MSEEASIVVTDNAPSPTQPYPPAPATPEYGTPSEAYWAGFAAGRASMAHTVTPEQLVAVVEQLRRNGVKHIKVEDWRLEVSFEAQRPARPGEQW